MVLYDRAAFDRAITTEVEARFPIEDREMGLPCLPDELLRLNSLSFRFFLPLVAGWPHLAARD